MASSKMNIELMKQFNRTAILRSIRDHAPIARSEISELLNLSRPSVSDIVSELIAEGWIRELNGVKGGRGRRPIPLEINPEGRYIIGVELGAFHITMILCNLRADILARHSFPMNSDHNVAAVLDQVSGSIPLLLQGRGIHYNQLLGIGVAMHGAVDPLRGISIFAPNLGWRNVAIGDELEARTGLMTLVENDCISSALAERWFGHGQEESNFITLLVDYGIGAGIVVDGKLYRGVHHIAGQLGHTTVDEDGPRCACGNYGCLEIMSSEPAIVRQAQKRLRMGEESVLRRYEDTGETLLVKHIYQAAQEGDLVSLDILKSAGHYLGVSISHLINILDPHTIIIGGGITEAASIVIPSIREVIQRRVMGDEAKQTPVLVSQLGEYLYPIGGATLVIDKVFDNPAGISS